ncbi:MAG: methyltransferase domain-containing protein [Pseudomonadales bacterium]
MNLADMVHRKDYALELEAGEIESVIQTVYGKKMRSVKMRARSQVRVLDSQKIKSMDNFPRFLNWKIDNSAGKSPVVLEIDIVGKSPLTMRHTLSRLRCEAGVIAPQLELDWPTWADNSSEYNFEIFNKSDVEANICTCYAFDPRAKILPLIQGNGVEIGPGGNPKILPAKDVDVQYIETMPAEEWNRLYNKQGNAIPEDLWSRYIVADARQLDHIEDESIDFVFSNHVFEHLVNPLQVIENWTRKLRVGGMIVGVVPDCRFTFDCRQRPSCSDEWLNEYEDGASDISMLKYEKWCEGTAPYNTPADLIARKYSIHVHYYSPDNFSNLASIAKNKGWVSSLFLNTSPNNKDFGFVLKK